MRLVAGIAPGARQFHGGLTMALGYTVHGYNLYMKIMFKNLRRSLTLL